MLAGDSRGCRSVVPPLVTVLRFHFGLPSVGIVMSIALLAEWSLPERRR